MAGKREHGKGAGKLFRRPGASLQRCAHTGDVRSKTSRAASGRRLGCVTPPIGWAGSGNCCWEQLLGTAYSQRMGKAAFQEPRRNLRKCCSPPTSPIIPINREEASCWLERSELLFPGLAPKDDWGFGEEG